uniref:Bradykinin-potentiating peptide 11d n=2 Tax=Crotalinae TaxID=8710 RepID=BPPBD_BOTJA|nr:RecName: Full=Bradykinin-potentiating peptide 1; Short=BPP-1; AltName: Full=Angiotensin-converting enzyme inhibitor 1 [Gloydius halys]P85161.1 RecName: Full=Bradykinin-potentiating peptide 11d; Short=BPP-11d [Bothrops jararaca]
QGRPPGPPIPP